MRGAPLPPLLPVSARPGVAMLLGANARSSAPVYDPAADPRRGALDAEESRRVPAARRGRPVSAGIGGGGARLVGDRRMSPLPREGCWTDIGSAGTPPPPTPEAPSRRAGDRADGARSEGWAPGGLGGSGMGSGQVCGGGGEAAEHVRSSSPASASRPSASMAAANDASPAVVRNPEPADDARACAGDRVSPAHRPKSSGSPPTMSDPPPRRRSSRGDDAALCRPCDPPAPRSRLRELLGDAVPTESRPWRLPRGTCTRGLVEDPTDSVADADAAEAR